MNPALGLKVLLQREQDELAWRQQRIEQNRAALAALAAEYTASSRSGPDGIEELDDVDDIRCRLEALAEGCRTRPWRSTPWAGSPRSRSTRLAR